LFWVEHCPKIQKIIKNDILTDFFVKLCGKFRKIPVKAQNQVFLDPKMPKNHKNVEE